jgi:hypothetical protein
LLDHPGRTSEFHDAVVTAALSDDPVRWSWPAAAAIISLVSMSLWGLIALAAIWIGLF